MEGVTVYRDYQIIDGFVQMPPNEESDKHSTTVDEALDAIAGSFYVEMPGAGNKVYKSGMVRFPLT